MDIFSIIALIGGLTFFLYGMSVLSTGLEKLAGGKLERALKKMTSNPWKSLFLGAGITIAIQSSSAMTVMLVGLVNSGIMQLGQTIGVIMGSNIGTTLTAWILSLSGIQSENIWMNLLKPINFSPIIALIGILMMMVSKKKHRRDIGTIFVGFAILMYGMTMMSDAVSPLADMPEFASLLTAFKNPLLGVLVGAAFTGIIQSSAASVSVLQALSMTGSITYGMAIPIIMGQNIGTCVTALLSSVGANKNGKRVAVVHIAFNLIGTITFLVILLVADAIFHFTLADAAINPVGIAAAHSIFNIATTALLLPFGKMLEKIAYTMIKGEADTKIPALMDERLFATPSVAMSECGSLTIRMAATAKDAVITAMGLVHAYDQKNADDVMAAEDSLDLYEDELGSYLVKLSGRDLSEDDSRKSSELLRNIGDFERIGDHAVNILESAQEMQDKGVNFSPDGQREVAVLTSAITEIITMMVSAFSHADVELARKIEPLEQVVDDLVFEIRKNHIHRLQTGICTIELGFILSDLLTNLERISDHCSNIAAAIIETERNNYSVHDYVNQIKFSGDALYESEFTRYKEKYDILP
ncbi:MAG: Na/Pi cotransporter family protein [Evtepia sp.]